MTYYIQHKKTKLYGVFYDVNSITPSGGKLLVDCRAYWHNDPNRATKYEDINDLERKIEESGLRRTTVEICKVNS